MADALCLPHKNRGVLARAVRIVGGTPMCQACLEGKAIVVPSRFSTIPEHEEDFPLPGPVEAKAKQIRKHKTTEAHVERKAIDWVAVQNDRSDGMGVAEIASKHAISVAMVYNKTRAVKGAKPARAARPATDTSSTTNRVKIKKVVVNGKPNTLQGALELLRSKRAEIDTAIAVLEGLS